MPRRPCEAMKIMVALVLLCCSNDAAVGIASLSHDQVGGNTRRRGKLYCFPLRMTSVPW